ncbi:uncharacterized protein LOC112100261 [Citrus clementina]|uniref:uncharacterized protein LOC112100261 n=1 Tax=Citrus clementina TaxID=85681 RepID=UPI000CECFFA5|nr:uncharacterized protein LOC112100261 [Citrus x clementina]
MTAPSIETFIAMDRVFSMETPRESKLASITLEKKRMVEQNRRKTENNLPDLTDFMNDMFFGTVIKKDKTEYNLTGGRLMNEDVDFDDSTRSNSGRLTQEWLQEAKRMVASSPTRCDSPSRLVGSPRFAAAQAARPSSSSTKLDRRDPLSRSARRQRSLEGFSGEILSRSVKHTRDKSASQHTLTPASPDQTPADAIHKWLSNLVKPSDLNSTPSSSPTSPATATTPSSDPAGTFLPPRQSTHRRSRFQTENPAPQSQGIPVNSRRTFRTAPTTQLPSPPQKLIVESAHKRTLSSSSCSSPTQPLNQPLSPPKNLVEPAQRRYISKSTCSVNEKVAPKDGNITNGRSHEEDGSRYIGLNEFLKEQRIMIDKISRGAVDAKAKIVLPAASNS